MSVTHRPKAAALLTGAEYEAADAHVVALDDADIPASIARDAEVTSAIATHAADTTAVHGIADTAALATTAAVAAGYDPLQCAWRGTGRSPSARPSPPWRTGRSACCGT